MDKSALLLDDKVRLRQSMLARREALHRSDAGAAALALAERAREILAARIFSVVAGYIPIGSEIDPLPLVTSLLGPKVSAALPVVVASGEALVFRAWTPGAVLERGKMGTSHPPPAHPEAAPDLILLPLLGFDRRCNRLGYGGGYYDRTLALLRRDKPVMAMGLAFAGQEVDVIPTGELDQKLDCVVTESAVFWNEDR